MKGLDNSGHVKILRKRIILDLHGLIADWGKAVLFEYE